MIKAYAYQHDYGRSVRLGVGRLRVIGNDDLFQPYIFESGTVRVGPEETLDPGTEPPSGLEIPTEMAEALYHALDRVFGKRDETPQIVKDVLAKEQARVDLLIAHVTKPPYWSPQP